MVKRVLFIIAMFDTFEHCGPFPARTDVTLSTNDVTAVDKHVSSSSLNSRMNCVAALNTSREGALGQSSDTSPPRRASSHDWLKGMSRDACDALVVVVAVVFIMQTRATSRQTCWVVTIRKPTHPSVAMHQRRENQNRGTRWTNERKGKENFDFYMIPNTNIIELLKILENMLNTTIDNVNNILNAWNT